MRPITCCYTLARPTHFDREFVTVDGQNVVMIGWENQSDFMTALGTLSQMPEMGAFFGIIDASAYQAAIVE